LDIGKSSQKCIFRLPIKSRAKARRNGAKLLTDTDL
jgi:hypothetical protein